MFKRYLLICITLMIVSCNSSDKKLEEEAVMYKKVNQFIHVVPNSELDKQVVAEEIAFEDIEYHFSTTGKVRPPVDKYAEITAPFEGRIVKNYVSLGQKIKKDDPIFELSSSSFFESQKEYLDAKEEWQLAKSHLRRQDDLLKNNVGSQQEAEIAKTDFQTKQNTYINAKAALEMWQINTETMVLGQPLIVRSPITGKLLDHHIILGQYVREDDEPLATIADLEKVWVAAQIKERDMSRLENIDSVKIKHPLKPKTWIDGKVFHISSFVNEATRSVDLLVECDNPNELFKPGMFTNLRLSSIGKDRITVPATAVIQKENSFVFREVEPHVYEAVKVKVGATIGNKLELLEGIQANDKVVTKGAILLLEAL